MIGNLFKKIIGTRNERILRALWKEVRKINALEPEMQALNKDQFRDKTLELKQRYQQGETLEDLLPEAFAVVREASRRTLGLRHFDVQLIGGMVLHQGKIAEMRTGEGKTLMSTLAAYLNVLTGNPVHVVTVNEYLAQRDAKWMSDIYEFLGLTVSVNLASMDTVQKKAAYAADVIYGTNNEFGFDYLRDNMVYRLDQRVQRGLHFAIIDEVDSILIDEARTPLIISGQAEASSDLYIKINQLIPQLKQQKMTEDQKEEDVPIENRGDYYLEEKNKQVFLTEQGHQRIEELMTEAGILESGTSLYDVTNISLMHYVLACLRANTLYKRDVDYVVKEGQILIVDEHTGRIMDGRRWSEGLHQAVEAEEGVTVQVKSQTLATITLQNYFRMFNKLSGMTGTADTEAYEFQKIYGLEVVVIPTNRPMVREDCSDKVYMNEKAKFNSILEDIKKCREKNQPVLVGTASIHNSERLSKLLHKEKIPHQVLNAKQHEREAKIIAEAGRPATVTIATNMAGRGTDIVLGGNLEAELAELTEISADVIERHKSDWKRRHGEVLKAGGLYVLATERHESRRIDNQLRGRAGRQGDPGASQFYLSMEDNLLRIFGGDRLLNLMKKLGVKEDEVIDHPMISRSIERAQRRVEGFNFDIRKQLLEFDDVANDQRKVIYQQRLELLEAEDISSTIMGIREEAISLMIDQYIPPQSLEEQWNIVDLENQIEQDFNFKLPITTWLEQEESLYEETLRERIIKEIENHYQKKLVDQPKEIVNQVEKEIMLQTLDFHWKEHLAAMDHLRKGIHLRGYAQKNPTQEYKRESFNLFTLMLDNIKYDVVSKLSKVEFPTSERIAEYYQQFDLAPPKMSYEHAEFSTIPVASTSSELQFDSETEPGYEPALSQESSPFVRQEPKIGRNDPCYCGSQKKYKHCHGKIGN